MPPDKEAGTVPLDVQALEQRFDLGDLVGLGVDGDLHHHGAAAMHNGTEQVQGGVGSTTLTWNFPTFKGPSNKSIRITHKVADNVPSGTMLSFSANVSAADGRGDSISKTVEIR